VRGLVGVRVRGVLQSQDEPPHRAEIAVLPKPWHGTFVRARRTFAKLFHCDNPCIAQLLQVAHSVALAVTSKC